MAKTYPIIGLIKDWKFRIDEVSPSNYLMEGRRRTGEIISKEGSNEVQLAYDISSEALKMDEKYLNPQKEPFKEFFFNTNLSEIFPEELQHIIIEEILLGNWIQDYWSGYGNGVLLANPFRISRKDIMPPLEYSDINDPHYWKDEVRLIGTDFFVAATFKK